MTSFYDSRDYYKKMLELQEKLRKSEEERIRLEERFKILLQESRNRHNTCINRLRFRYIEFLEEQRTTDERNHKLLEALDRVDNSLALMTARTNRLNSLRKHYEAYLRRICTVPADGIDDTSVQQSDKYLGTEQRNSLPPEARSTLPLQSSWSNYQPIKSSFLSPSQTPKSAQNVSFIDSSSSIVDSRTPNQQISNDRKALQTYSKHLQQDFERLPTFNLSSPVFQQSQTYNNNVRLESRGFQTDPKLQSLHVNTFRAMPHLAMPYHVNDGTSMDISQNQTAQSIMQYPISSPRMQSFPLQESHKLSLDNLQRKIRSGNFQNAPRSVARNMSDTPLYFDMDPHPSYLNYSFNNNEHNRNDITDTFPRYTNNNNERVLSTDTKQSHTEEDEDKVSTTTDSEFHRYINRIRKLHHDLDKQSCNAAVSNTGSEASTKDELDENLTNKVKQVLSLAENLVSRTMNMNGTKCVEQEEVAEQKDHELRRTVQSCVPVSEINQVEISDAHEGRVTSMAHAKDRISNDITLQQPKLESFQNMEKSKNQNSACIDVARASEQPTQRAPELQKDHSLCSSQDNRIYNEADEVELEQCSYNICEDLEPWNLNYDEKQVKEVNLITDIHEQVVEKDLILDGAASNENKVMGIESNIERNRLDEYEVDDFKPVQEVILNDTSDVLQSQNNEYFEVNETKDEDDETFIPQLRASEIEDANSLNVESKQQDGELPDAQNLSYNAELPNTENIFYNVESSKTENILEHAELTDNEYVQQKDYDDNEAKYIENNEELDVIEDDKPTNITLHDESNNQDYNESDQAKDSVHTNDVEYSHVNEEYNYDQNESYDYDKKEEYEGYANQEYAQETSDQYEGYTSEQYDQYINNPENAYETDANAQYQEDTNEKYSYPYNEQYNSNQESVPEENQEYELKETEMPQEQEDESKQDGSDEYTEHENESQNEVKDDVLEKVDENQSEKLPSTNEKKKGKDVIKSLLDSDTDSTLEQNISNTESDFDFN